MENKSDNLPRDILKLVFGVLAVIGSIVFIQDDLSIFGKALVASFLVTGIFSSIEGFLSIFIDKRKEVKNGK